ncbi:MAG: TetR/AcrR family transcriptional regulator [Bacteroidales bacterium]|nr:TetR/AcrR family transcriptional regulator [Bacteroidales bacterium]
MSNNDLIILEGARELFRNYGLRSVSMDDICRYVGISKKTLYRFVENKAALIDKMIDLDMEEMGTIINEHKAGQQNAIDELLEQSKFVHQHINNIKPAFLYDLQKYYPHIHQRFMREKRKWIINHVIKNLRQGIEEGLYRTDLNLELVALLYSQKLEDMQNPEFINSGDFTFEKIFEVMFDNHIRGISNQDGIAYYEQQKSKLNFKITNQ